MHVRQSRKRLAVALENLILGGDSLIGSNLARFWKKRRIPINATTRDRNKVSKERGYVNLETQEWGSVLSRRYNAVVFCAGITSLEACEADPAKTHRINVNNAGVLLSRLSSIVNYILILSSSQVFDGSKPDRTVSEDTCPINEYGRQKVALERDMILLRNVGVLRLTKVIHPEWKLERIWRERLAQHRPIKAYKNVTFSPVKVEKVVHEIDRLVKQRSASLHHLAGTQNISYWEFGRKIARQLGVSEDLVQETTRDPESRISYSSLM